MPSSFRIYPTALLAAVLLAVTTIAAGAFVDRTVALGVNVTPGGGDYGHGCAFVDIDNDGVLELYVTMFIGQPNLLFNYDPQSGQFVDIAPARGCADILDAHGVAWADYDNDGDQDFFVANFQGPNRLYQNDGAGNFTDVAPALSMDRTDRCYSVAWGDYDNDGYLDLFVCVWGRGIPTPNPNFLYHNNGDGTFTERAASAGVAAPQEPGVVCAWFDYDSDGDADLYVGNDNHVGNTLYRNNNDGTFSNVTSLSLIDSGPSDLVYTETNGDRRLPMNAMGIAVADYDDNGHLDLFITNSPDVPAALGRGGHGLLRNRGDGTFVEVSAEAEVMGDGVGWGAVFLDYDNDGDDDIYAVQQEAGNILYSNNGDGTFTDVTTAAGLSDLDDTSYGLTAGDYNDDGFCGHVRQQSGDAVGSL